MSRFARRDRRTYTINLGVAWPIAFALLVLAAFGCASDNTDTTGSTQPSSTSAGGSGGPGGSSSSGMAGEGGSGGSSSPCAMDCSKIQSPQCLKAVCNTGMYPGQIGTCVVVPDADGIPCDDGEFC